MLWRFCPYVGFWIFYSWMYLWVDDMTFWRVCYISVVMFYCWNFYACQLKIIWRRDVYFLNIRYIHVIYHFNRSRALHKVVNQMKAFLVREIGKYFNLKFSLFAISPASVRYRAICLTVDSLVSPTNLVNLGVFHPLGILLLRHNMKKQI